MSQDLKATLGADLADFRNGSREYRAMRPDRYELRRLGVEPHARVFSNGRAFPWSNEPILVLTSLGTTEGALRAALISLGEEFRDTGDGQIIIRLRKSAR